MPIGQVGKESGSSNNSGVLYRDILVTSAQIFTLFTVPVALVPAPGNGLAICPLSLWMLWVPGNTPFVCDAQRFVVDYPGSNAQDMFIADPTGNIHIGFVSNGNESGIPAGPEPINLDGTVAQYFTSTVIQTSEYFGGGTNLASIANNNALTVRLSASDPTVLGNGTLSIRTFYGVVPTARFG